MVGIKLNKGSDLLNIICLDTETTGLNHYDDEILQLSIIDGSGAILFSEYVKPVHHECWTDAEKVNHISPSSVRKLLNEDWEAVYNTFSNQEKNVFWKSFVESVLVYEDGSMDIRFL